MKKKNLKAIAAMLAMISIITVTAAGCGNKTDAGEELVTNVITQASDADADESTPADGTASAADEPQATETVLDENGNVVTDAAGEPVTQPAATAAPSDDQGGSEDFFAEMTTKAAPVVDTSVDNTTRYAYNTLSDDEKALYDAILDHAHSSFDGCSVKVRHLCFCDLADLILSDLTNLGLVRNSGTAFDTDSLLDKNGCGRSLSDE